MTIELQTRRSGMSIGFFSAQGFGDANMGTWEPAVGNLVSLKYGDVDIEARVIEAVERRYKAEIVSLDGVGYDEPAEVATGTVLEFEHRHIFGCTR